MVKRFRFKDWKISQKLFLEFFVIMFCFIIIGGYTAFYSFKIQKQAREIEIRHFTGVNLASSMKETVLEIQHLIVHVILSSDAAFIEDIDIMKEKFYILLSEFKELVRHEPKMVKQLGELRKVYDEYMKSVENFVHAGLYDQPLAEDIHREGKDLLFSIEDVYNEDVALLSQALGKIYNVASKNRQINIMLAVFAMLIVSIISFFVMRAIIIPISKLLDGTRKVAKGDFSVKVDIEGKDEIAELSDSFNKMAVELSQTTTSLDDLNKEVIQRRKTEDLLGREKEFSKVVFDNMRDAICVLDVRDFRILEANKVFLEQYSNLCKEEIIGKTCYEIVHNQQNPCMPSQHTCPLKETLKTGQYAISEHVHYTKKGEELYVEMSTVPIADKDGKIIQAIHIARDITKQKKMEKFKEARDKAEQAYKTKSQFLANMSHEIRTPMNAILGFSDILTRTPLDENQKNYIRTIQSSGKLLLRVIDDILDVSKIESGKVTLECIDFSLEYLITDVFNIVVSKIKDKGIEIFVDIAKDIPCRFRGDPMRLRQIFINLLNNSIKFTSEGEIGVIVRRAPEGYNDEEPLLCIIVKDTGMGIPDDRKKIIFEAFSQVDESTTRKFGGTGLGLSICKLLIEAMGGEIRVESQEGKWSEFIFTVRLRKGESISKKEIYPLSQKELQGKTAIVVDDYQRNREIIKRYCEEAGIDVFKATDSGKEVLDLLEELAKENRLPNVILCDVMMSEMNGDALAEKIRENQAYHAVKIIAITSDVRFGTAQWAKDKGFDGYLAKPVFRDSMFKVIAMVLGDKRGKGEIVTKHMAAELICKGIRILVVDDSQPNQALIQAYFDELGCTGDFVSNGQEAIDKLKTDSHYDLCLMDIQMPIMGGIEATEIIRKEVNKDIPIIALAAAVMKEDYQDAKAVGMNDFLPKPVTIMQLKEKIIQYGRT